MNFCPRQIPQASRACQSANLLWLMQCAQQVTQREWSASGTWVKKMYFIHLIAVLITFLACLPQQQIISTQRGLMLKVQVIQRRPIPLSYPILATGGGAVKTLWREVTFPSMRVTTLPMRLHGRRVLSFGKIRMRRSFCTFPIMHLMGPCRSRKNTTTVSPKWRTKPNVSTLR